MNDAIRSARRDARPIVTQEELARALGTTRQRLIDHEVWHKPLPRGITPSEALDVIAKIREQKRAAQ